jgi:ABC-type amino acid transport substrate-binding protein
MAFYAHRRPGFRVLCRRGSGSQNRLYSWRADRRCRVCWRRCRLHFRRRCSSGAGYRSRRAADDCQRHPALYGLYADGGKGIAQLNQLKGKIVGVTGAGGIAEYAAVEGLAKKGFVRDRDYKILYGVGNSPARAQALEAGRIQASPFSFLERMELEQKGFPVLFDIGKVLPGFPFVVIVSAKRRVESDPEGVIALLRAMKRSLDYLKSDRERSAWPSPARSLC